MMLFPSSLVLLGFITVGNAVREAKDEEFPFQVSIQTLENRHLCGGAIITPKWILTASRCFQNENFVRVTYGSVDSNNPIKFVKSHRIIKNNPLALVELERSIEFSKTAKAAGLPTLKAEIRNNTKLSGWKVMRDVDVPPNLYVSDVYSVILKDCRSPSGALVNLNYDQFCGIDEESSHYELFNPGTTVSKSAVILGILADPPISPGQACIYIKVSEHGQWIKDTLMSDAQHVNWVDNTPKDSATAQGAISLVTIAIPTIFLRLL